MIWQFGELGYDYSINTCEDGTVNDNCRLSPKPVKWSYYDNPNRKRVYNVFKALIDLKKNEPAFSTADFSIDGGNSLYKTIHLNHSSMDVTIVGNFDVVDGSLFPNFQQAGIWYDFFSNDSINVINTNDPLNLSAGEFHVYTTKKLNQGSYLDVEEGANIPQTISVFPNPVDQMLQIQATEEVTGIRIFDAIGHMVISIENTKTSMVTVDTQSLPKGLYMVNASLTNGQTLTQKFVKK